MYIMLIDYVRSVEIHISCTRPVKSNICSWTIRVLCKYEKVKEFERNRPKSIRVIKLGQHNIFSQTFSVIDRPDARDVRTRTCTLGYFLDDMSIGTHITSRKPVIPLVFLFFFFSIKK